RGCGASEAAVRATISVKRTGPLTDVLTLSYATADGTAQQGVDYMPASGVLTFPRGVAVRAFPVKLVHDTLHKPPRTVNLTLSNQSAGILATADAVLTINDDDLAGAVQFSVSNLAVSEGATNATVKVVRTGKARGRPDGLPLDGRRDRGGGHELRGRQ